MKKVLLGLMMLLGSLKGMSQAKEYVLFGGDKTWKKGFVLGLNGGYWPQDKMNHLLDGNNAAGIHYPTLKDMSMWGSLGVAFQKGKNRLTYGYEIMRNKSDNDAYKLEERMDGWFLKVQRAVYRTEQVSISPEFGLGMTGKKLNLLAKNTSNGLDSALATPNAVNLFGRLFYADFAVNIGLCYDKDMMDHWLQLVVGYKYCFSGTNWSTSLSGQTIANSDHDYLRMVYVGVKLNSLRLGK